MFPITHIWFSKKVLGYINHLTILGAVFPDPFASKYLTYDDTHKCGWAFFDYIIKGKQELSDFAKAVVTHTVSPKGLDYYADEQYEGSEGYCFQKAVVIVDDVINACNIPIEYGLWKAHNFIEMAVEVEILINNQWIIQSFSEALYDIDITNTLESFVELYFNLEPCSMKNAFKRLESFVKITGTTSYDFALQYDLVMQRRHGINIDVGKSSKIIEICREIINEDFTGFINDVEHKVKNTLFNRLELD